MSKSINYGPPFRSSEPNSQLLDEVSALRVALRRVIRQRDDWQARYAEVTQQLDEMRRAAGEGK